MIGNAVRRLRSLGPIFFLTVVIPTTLAVLYYGLFASDVYLSESQFVVRSPDKPSQSGLGLLLSSSGFGNAGEEVYAAQEFVQSRDALQAVNRNGAFVRAYGNPAVSVFDRFNGFGLDGTFEALYDYYGDKVTVDHDTTASIVTMTVRAYSAEDARQFNRTLLDMAEATVNRLNLRGRQDLIRFAQVEVDEALRKAQAAAAALSSYRNQQGVVDPEEQATIQIQMISKLQDELIATRTQLRELRVYAPQNPQIAVLTTRAAGLSAEIDAQLRQIAGSSRSLSTQAAQFQRLTLENQFAERQLASAMASLEEARNEARRKQAYVERIVEPNLPDAPLEPRRWRGVFSVLLLGLAAWAIITMLLAGMLEHRD